MGNLAHAMHGWLQLYFLQKIVVRPYLAAAWLGAESMDTRSRKQGQYEFIQGMASGSRRVVALLSLLVAQLCAYPQWLDTHCWLYGSCPGSVLYGEILPGARSLAHCFLLL